MLLTRPNVNWLPMASGRALRYVSKMNVEIGSYEYATERRGDGCNLRAVVSRAR